MSRSSVSAVWTAGSGSFAEDARERYVDVCQCCDQDRLNHVSESRMMEPAQKLPRLVLEGGSIWSPMPRLTQRSKCLTSWMLNLVVSPTLAELQQQRKRKCCSTHLADLGPD